MRFCRPIPYTTCRYRDLRGPGEARIRRCGVMAVNVQVGAIVYGRTGN